MKLSVLFSYNTHGTESISLKVPYKCQLLYFLSCKFYQEKNSFYTFPIIQGKKYSTQIYMHTHITEIKDFQNKLPFYMHCSNLFYFIFLKEGQNSSN